MQAVCVWISAIPAYRYRADCVYSLPISRERRARCGYPSAGASWHKDGVSATLKFRRCQQVCSGSNTSFRVPPISWGVEQCSLKVAQTLRRQQRWGRCELGLNWLVKSSTILAKWRWILSLIKCQQLIDWPQWRQPQDSLMIASRLVW